MTTPPLQVQCYSCGWRGVLSDWPQHADDEHKGQNPLMGLPRPLGSYAEKPKDGEREAGL